ncbi:putative tyrosine-protein phosphatase OCA6 [Choanephora cucurbitarum]|uniref:Putative tyrosine-protein phosphatase OCA6 n=1 Tax=Choanephora cucurbitarum TaxID=101091 RepID=A0A1C7NCP8_9FUNG|nr:putative tyrosine-protein phosphatase OCA6 [Choanephora cucurbitarum]
MPIQLPNLIPPFRFSIVEENLFRGGYPKPRNKRFLKRLHLKTILSLIPDRLIPEMQQFCEENNIRLLHLTVDKMKEDNIPLSYNKTLMALQLIVDPTNHPIYVHCLDGADVTGLVIACLRKLQMWSHSSAMNEFARNLHTNVISSEEFEFIENFKQFEVTIPMTLPSWLWGGQVNFRKHPSLRLKFLNSDMMTTEERELKEKKEKKEKEKEDYYKKRKNDLLDNLFDPNTPNTRHRTVTNTTNVTGVSNNNSNNVNDNTTNTNNGSHNSASVNNSSSNNSSSNNNSSNNSNNNNSNSSNSNSSNNSNNSNNGSNSESNNISSSNTNNNNNNNRAIRFNNKVNSPLLSLNHTDSFSSNLSTPSSERKDDYLVDVDVDVDGVMMDGLDQVEFINRTTGNSSGNRFYSDVNNDMLLIDEEGDMYMSDQKNVTEVISRTLDALALEGLTEF